MSAQLQSIVLHPKVSQALRVLSTTVGREKTYRAIQYFARFYAWFLLIRGYSDQASRWDALKAALATGRRLIRLFKPVEHLQAAVTTYAPHPSHPLETYTSVFRQVALAGYMTFDSFVWANHIRFLRLDVGTAVKVNRIAQRFWLAGILFSIANGVVKLNRHVKSIDDLKNASRAEKRDIPASGQEVPTEVKALYKSKSAIRYQLIQDCLDVWLPASNLSYVYISDGLAGIIGIVTSMMALNIQWANAAK